MKRKEVDKMTNKSVAGAVIGAAVVGIAAGAAALTFKDPKNRKKLEKVVTEVGRNAQKFIKDTQSKPEVKQALKAGKKMVSEVSKGKSVKSAVKKTESSVN